MNKVLQHLGWVTVFAGIVGLSASSCTTEAYCFVCEETTGEAGESSSTTRPSNVVTTGIISMGGSSQNGGGQGGEDSNGGEAGSPTECPPNIDFDTDPDNCGACGVQCLINGAIPICVDGECSWEECVRGREDFNGNPVDGCEAVCNRTNDGEEICDGVDNDCDSEIDEGFDLTTVDNCGTCGNECLLAHATPKCEEVSGNYRCRVDTCEDTFFDFDGVDENGCEKQCLESNDGTEICDGKDNDCDGQVDEETPGAGEACDEGMCPWDPNGECLGQCVDRGHLICSGNQLVCVPRAGAPTQGIEVCDEAGLDEDCDGQANEDFDLSTDPNNCGECGRVCDLPNAFTACQAGQCVVAGCQNGYGDLDPETPGCEYECPESVKDEACDGVDNDCDGIVDNDVVEPSQDCLTTGPCSGTTWVCGEIPGTSETGWYCNYQEQDDRIEVDPTTIWPGPELACDGFDNNCDGAIDEGMGRYQYCTGNNQCTANCNKGRCTCSTDAECDVGYGCVGSFCVAQCFAGVGECQDVDTVACAGDGNGVVCNAEADTDNASDEACDGLDNNCDGQIDEIEPAAGNAFAGVVDDVVFVDNSGTSNDFYIYRYEAARPDSLSTDSGVSAARACSKAGVLPWTSLNQAEAADACEAAGMELCTQNQWEDACEADQSGTVWSFATDADTYTSGICNDVEGGTGAAWAGGSGEDCYADSPNGAIFDMSGNVSEWTQTQVNSGGKSYFRVRGGNYTAYGPATACNFSFVLGVPTFANADLGFRCCGTNPPNVP